MKKNFLILIILILILINVLHSSNVVTKETLVKKIQEFFSKTKTMTGNFILSRNNFVERGHFYYQSPDKFKMVFGFNTTIKIEEKTIVSTGRQLWVYLPAIKVVINQDTTRSQSNIAYAGAGFGIRRLIRKYEYEFYNNDSSYKTERDIEEPVRILRLHRSRSFTGFKEILLFVREDGFIPKSRAITQDNKIIELIRRNVKLNENIDNRHFVFRVPQDAQIIKNPLVSGGSTR